MVALYMLLIFLAAGAILTLEALGVLNSAGEFGAVTPMFPAVE